MTNRIAKDEMALLMPNSLGHYFQDDASDMPPADEQPSLFARIAGFARWVAALPQRQAVLAELNALSDHELADIGLSRSDLPMVFDADFAAQRTNERVAARVQNGRASLI
jgi:uncharacterized protein YjiS (DUF1127 family)